jgi:hypothetical protein
VESDPPLAEIMNLALDDNLRRAFGSALRAARRKSRLVRGSEEFRKDRADQPTARQK